MERESVTAMGMLAAVYQGYMAMYAVLKRSGMLVPGEIAELLRCEDNEGAFPEEALAAMRALAGELDRIDRGGRVLFDIIQGGVANDQEQ